MGNPLNNTNTNTNTSKIVLTIPIPIPIQLKNPIPIPIPILLANSGTDNGFVCVSPFFQCNATKAVSCLDKEGRFPNRIVRWTDDGLEYEADPRQAGRFIETIGLSGDNFRSTETPGLKCTKEQVGDEKDLEPHEHTPYRGNGARCNYLGPDRPNIKYSAKEICRRKSSPTNLGQDALKRLCRFLVGRKCLAFN